MSGRVRQRRIGELGDAVDVTSTPDTSHTAIG